MRQSNAYGESNSHIHADSYTNCDGDSNGYAYTHSYANGDCNSDGYSNCDQTAATYTDATASADAAAACGQLL